MIIRHKHKGRFSIVPNGIFHDPRLSLPAKGLLVYLLSLPPDWEVRHDHLQDKLRIGRKLLESAFKEIIAAGYAVPDEIQGRDEHHLLAAARIRTFLAQGGQRGRSSRRPSPWVRRVFTRRR